MFKKVIWEYEEGLLYKKGKIKKKLEPGSYFYPWFLGYRIIVYDKRVRNLSIPTQEIITKDQISLKFTLSLRYSIVDSQKYYLSSIDPENNLYQIAQEQLRKSIEVCEVDGILQGRTKISQEIEKELKNQYSAIGVEIVNAFLKDIILSAHLKEIFSKIIETKKVSQAVLVSTREQVANARALKNLSKMYNEDPILLKLLELQTAKEIGEKGGTIVLGNLGGNQVLGNKKII